MRLVHSLILLLILLSSCESGRSKQVEIDDLTGVKKTYYTDEAGVLSGEYVVTDNDLLIEKAHYQEGVLHGVRLLYGADGNVEIKEIYDTGVLTDTVYIYYETGAIKLKLPYKTGKIQGTSFKYYPTGVLMETVTFVDSEEQGPFVEYHANGGVHWRGNYRNGDNEYGEIQQYDSTGVLIKTMLCDTLAICRTTFALEN